jgi:hypothetical protein
MITKLAEATVAIEIDPAPTMLWGNLAVPDILNHPVRLTSERHEPLGHQVRILARLSRNVAEQHVQSGEIRTAHIPVRLLGCGGDIDLVRQQT